MADVDRRVIFFQRPLDDFDRAHHAGAEAARLRQHHAQGFAPVLAIGAAGLGVRRRRSPRLGFFARKNLARLGDDAGGVELGLGIHGREVVLLLERIREDHGADLQVAIEPALFGQILHDGAPKPPIDPSSMVISAS